MLFYDPVLSENNQLSCATCHQPSRAFTDGLALSAQGVSGKLLHRNAPSLVNLAWHKGLFWDGGASDLESLVFGPLTHPDEMGQDLHALVQELDEKAVYRDMFKRAFGEDTIYSALVGRALAQYLRTLISANSRFDQFIRNEAGANFSGIELKGIEVFDQKCGCCHLFGLGKNDFFTDHQYHNNGLDSAFSSGPEGILQGRFRITRDSADMGKFKTPSLRNIALTTPYMHDGRFATLEQVLDHYDSKMKYFHTLDSIFHETEGRVGISLTEGEKEAIIVFLHTLTDTAFVQN
jgi:cytochrome c peroxidase